MRIIEQNFLREQNAYATTPCLISVLDLQALHGVLSSDIPGFTERLLMALPSLQAYRYPPRVPGGFAERSNGYGFVQRLRDGIDMAQIVEYVALELQCLTGTNAAFSCTQPADCPGHFQVVCSCQNEKVIDKAFQLAVDLVTALARKEEFSLDQRLAALRHTAVYARLDETFYESSIRPRRFNAIDDMAELSEAELIARMSETIEAFHLEHEH